MVNIKMNINDWWFYGGLNFVPPVIILAASLLIFSNCFLFSSEQLSHIILAYSKRGLTYVVYNFRRESLSSKNLFFLNEPIRFHAFSQILEICGVQLPSLLIISPRCLCFLTSLICVFPINRGG